MDKLPPEIVLQILDYTIVAHYGDKNNLLKLRTTCKLFDEVLKPYVLKTLQLEFTRLDKAHRARQPLDDDALRRIGPLCQSLYVDMMVVRDEVEVKYLGEMFSQIPTMGKFVEQLRDGWCMNETSFTEIDYRRQLGLMLENAPNVTAVKLNLPFQLVSPGQYRASTMVIGNTFAALAQRPEESETLKTLVLENLSAISVVSLWRNPQDVKNIMGAFRDLRRLFMSIRRNNDDGDHDHDGPATRFFPLDLWQMIGKAEKLETLCLVDLDTEEKRPHKDITTSSSQYQTLDEWQERCMPTINENLKPVLPNLTFLELRQVEVSATGLLTTFKCFADSLRELYLDGVYLKTLCLPRSKHTFWVGLPNERPPPRCCWIATHLRQMRVKLSVCRVANLGYDQYVVEPVMSYSKTLTYDLADPSGQSRTLEQRFVEVATGIEQPPAPDGTPVAYYPEEEAQDAWALASEPRPTERPRTEDWHAGLYLATRRNPTSAWQRSIDGLFPNCNQHTLKALHDFANAAHRGMTMLNQAVDEQLEERRILASN